MLLKELIPTILQTSLSTITEESRRTTSINSSETLGPCDLLPGLEIPSIEFGIDLTTALDQVKWSYSPVSDAAGEDPADGAGGVVLGGVQLDLAGVFVDFHGGFVDFVLKLRTEVFSLLLDVVADGPCREKRRVGLIWSGLRLGWWRDGGGEEVVEGGED